MIKVLNAHVSEAFTLALDFSDHTHGIFDGADYLQTRHGPLLDKLRDPAYFARVFIDAGALCWPNGLELSPATVHACCKLTAMH